MKRGYCKLVNYISMLSFPMLAGMFVVAPEFVRLVYGERWAPSIIVLQIFCITGAFKSLGNLAGPILLAKGRADIGFYWNVFAAIMLSIAVIVGVNWGIVGVAVAILILQVPFFFIIQPIVNRLIDLKFSQYFEAIQLPFVCSVMMLAGIIPLRMILGNINVLLLFITTVTVGVIICTVSYYIKDRAIFLELKTMLKER